MSNQIDVNAVGEAIGCGMKTGYCKRMKTFNEKDWMEYRAAHPEQRYWQALRAYMEIGYIWMSVEEGDLIDTFYIKNK